jgi:hypothetical protein
MYTSVEDPLSHKQRGLIHQLSVWLGRDLKKWIIIKLSIYIYSKSML